jgi:hypothetical protein
MKWNARNTTVWTTKNSDVTPLESKSNLPFISPLGKYYIIIEEDTIPILNYKTKTNVLNR